MFRVIMSGIESSVIATCARLVSLRTTKLDILDVHLMWAHKTTGITEENLRHKASVLISKSLIYRKTIF